MSTAISLQNARMTDAQINQAHRAMMDMRNATKCASITDQIEAIAALLLEQHDPATAHYIAQAVERMIERGMP